MVYRGRYNVKNITKYRGDHRDVVYRSLWEMNCFRYLDHNPNVIEWSSETVVIPYRCKTDGRIHRYFVDLFVRFVNKTVLLVEIKPNAQTKMPKKPVHYQGKRRYIKESLTYAKNVSKWEAAEKYCEKRGWNFEIWDENALRSIGIKV